MSRTNTYLRELPPGLTHIDVYWVLRLFEVTDPCVQHAVKKLLADGSGDKDRATNILEAWETLDRWREMQRYGPFDDEQPPPDERQEQVRERYDFSQLTLAARTTTDTPGTPCCWTHAADWQRQRFIVCEVCGNKRCPHATDCSLDCTGSNEPGQPGSRFADAPPDPAGQLGDYGACGVDAERPADGRPSRHNCPSGANCRNGCGLGPCPMEASE